MDDPDEGLYGDIGDFDPNTTFDSQGQNDGVGRTVAKEDVAAAVGVGSDDRKRLSADPDFASMLVLSGLEWWTSDADVEELVSRAAKPNAVHFKVQGALGIG